MIHKQKILSIILGAVIILAIWAIVPRLFTGEKKTLDHIVCSRLEVVNRQGKRTALLNAREGFHNLYIADKVGGHAIILSNYKGSYSGYSSGYSSVSINRHSQVRRNIFEPDDQIDITTLGQPNITLKNGANTTTISVLTRKSLLGSAFIKDNEGNLAWSQFNSQFKNKD